MISGAGIARGMLVTLRHFFEAIGGAISLPKSGRTVVQPVNETGVFTVQYPEERLQVPERFRYFPFLLYEPETGAERCTSCGICAKVCPPQCIWIVRDNDEAGKPIPEPREFYIDMSICMQCGLCAEYCPFDAIKMDHDYELASYERFDTLIYDKKRLMRPIEYYANTHPTDFEDEETARRAKEEADRKRAEARAARAKRAGKPAPRSRENE